MIWVVSALIFGALILAGVVVVKSLSMLDGVFHRSVKALEDTLSNYQANQSELLSNYTTNMQLSITSAVEAIGKAAYGARGDSPDDPGIIPPNEYPDNDIDRDWTDTLIPDTERELVGRLMPGQQIPGIKFEDLTDDGPATEYDGYLPAPDLAGENWIE